jgi:hypothetical protein
VDRLKHGSVSFHLKAQLAGAGDQTRDPTKPWPAQPWPVERKTEMAGSSLT